MTRRIAEPDRAPQGSTNNMIQQNVMERPPTTAVRSQPRIWGLSAVELHDAYWRSQGVQVLSRASGEVPERGADLYLLVEPGQAVVFDLSQIVERITWSGAVVTRVRIVEEDDERYHERIITDEEGNVERIERLYTPRAESSYRVIATRSRRVAALWVSDISRREAWKRTRRLIPYYQIDHWRLKGHCLDSTDHRDEQRLLNQLVQNWTDPGRAIVGVELIGEHVWAPAGVALADSAIAVGPVWMGYERETDEEQCFIGPAWFGDASDCDELPCRIRAIREIEPGERQSVEAPVVPSSDAGYNTAKRAFDIFVSLMVLIATAPLFLVVSIAILVSDGRPVFYGHRRQTRGGRIFRCWKFRTMRRDADKLTEELQKLNVCDGPQFYIENDPRVTRTGHILRKWHIDELPQFWNVLVGEMSIVGPRPSPDKENQYCPAWREIRLSVRPGITGLWQVERTRQPGRDFQEWIRFDIEYVRSASFWTDMQICMRTFAQVVLRRKYRAADKTG